MKEDSSPSWKLISPFSRPDQSPRCRYDADAIREEIEAAGIEAVIPAKVNRRRPVPHDRAKYKWRNLIERLFNKLKNWRRVATRYDKTKDPTSASSRSPQSNSGYLLSTKPDGATARTAALKPDFDKGLRGRTCSEARSSGLPSRPGQNRSRNRPYRFMQTVLLTPNETTLRGRRP